MKGRLVLASASPRRIELLQLIGLEVLVIPSGVTESPLDDETPETHVIRLSREKAESVSRDYPRDWVLGADTIVVIDGEILGKPESREEARQMLTKLSNREHTVFTGYTLSHGNEGRIISEAVESTVLIKSISAAEMDWYTQTDEPYDKAGGYAVQGRGAFFIRAIHGSYTNVMGLPLCEVVDTLTRVGAIGFNGGRYGSLGKG
jgi:septum formation protein